MSDAQHYRTKDEVNEYRKIDPITQVREHILKNKFATEDELASIDADVKTGSRMCRLCRILTIPRNIFDV